MQAAPAKPLGDQDDRDLSDMLDDIEPLALSPSQIVEEGEDADGFSFDSILADTESTETEAPGLVEAEDVTFDADDDLPSFEPAPARELPADPPPPAAKSAPEPAFQPEPDPEPTFEPELQAPPEPEPTMDEPVAQAESLPDPTLTADMADQLLEPATRAAVRGSIGKLSALGIGNPGLTIEAMMRDMLRPMLKEWLDENLPAVVERMVEKEIARVSRGE
jgi:hypothetical protein